MLDDYIIMPVYFPFELLVVLCRKNNKKHSGKAWRSSIECVNSNAITQNLQFPISEIDEILTNFVSIQYLTSRYFQIAMKPKNITKIVPITKNVCFVFKLRSASFSDAPFTFQKAMHKIPRPLLGKGVLVYLDDIIVVATKFDFKISEINFYLVA